MAFSIADVPTIPDTLNVIHHHRGVPNERMARLARVKPPQMTHIRKEERVITLESLQELAIGLCPDGITDIAQAFLTPDYVVCKRGEGRADGSLSEETQRLVLAVAEALRCFAEKDIDGGIAALASCRTVMEDMHTEFDALREASR